MDDRRMCAAIKSFVTATALLLVGSHANAQHLWWDLEGQRDATCLYGTITVLATHPAIYYCGANWHPGEPAGGYCGIQHNGVKERRTIFSIWDTSPRLHPRITEADPYTVFGRFGGEGEGGHTHMLWPWKVGETFEFFVRKEPGKVKDTTDTRYYIRDDKTRGWRHLATINNPNGGHQSVTTIAGGINSFLENFAGRDQDVPKVALYRLWLGSSVDSLRALSRAQGDGTWGQLHDAYFLAEGAKNRLDGVFKTLEKTHGKPVFGGQGRTLSPLSNKAIPASVIDALKKLPRADTIKDQSDSPRDGKEYIIRSVVAYKRLAIEKGSKVEGSQVVQDASSQTHVVWKLKKIGDAFQIINTSSGLALDANGQSSLTQKTPSRSLGQAWEFVRSGDAFQIKSRQNGQVLDVSGGSSDDGAVVILYTRNPAPSPNQRWILTEVGE